MHFWFDAFWYRSTLMMDFLTSWPTKASPKMMSGFPLQNLENKSEQHSRRGKISWSPLSVLWARSRYVPLCSPPPLTSHFPCRPSPSRRPQKALNDSRVFLVFGTWYTLSVLTYYTLCFLLRHDLLLTLIHYETSFPSSFFFLVFLFVRPVRCCPFLIVAFHTTRRSLVIFQSGWNEIKAEWKFGDWTIELDVLGPILDNLRAGLSPFVEMTAVDWICFLTKKN